MAKLSHRERAALKAAPLPTCERLTQKEIDARRKAAAEERAQACKEAGGRYCKHLNPRQYRKRTYGAAEYQPATQDDGTFADVYTDGERMRGTTERERTERAARAAYREAIRAFVAGETLTAEQAAALARQGSTAHNRRVYADIERERVRVAKAAAKRERERSANAARGYTREHVR